MPIINLTIDNKTAMGDGTKIVCMNSDYEVNIKCENCDTFVNAPVKKLIIKSGWNCVEADIQPVEGNPDVLHANLPAVDATQSSIELGVCGKDTDDINEMPKFTSMPAVFDCAKSILCGAVIIKKDPVYYELTATSNGTYNASENNADGYSKVIVAVPEKLEDSVKVSLDLQYGDQVVVPAYDSHTLKDVTILKPVGLIPENIRKGTSIAGVSGTFENLVGQPIEVSTVESMDYILQTANDTTVGYIYKYTGASTETYEQGTLYIIEAVAENV